MGPVEFKHVVYWLTKSMKYVYYTRVSVQVNLFIITYYEDCMLKVQEIGQTNVSVQHI